MLIYEELFDFLLFQHLQRYVWAQVSQQMHFFIII